MRKVLIGSAAIKHYYPDFNRIPKDIDYAVDEEKRREQGVEYLYNPVVFNYTSSDVLELNLLLSLKVSHIFWNINWEKHMWDIQYLFKKGCIMDIQYIKEQMAFWEKHLPKVRRSDLKLTKEDFFTNAINPTTDSHDELHQRLVGEGNIPAFQKILKDGCEVELDESKWRNLSFSEKCDVVYEETAVMAFERYNSSLFWKTAFNRQLKDNIIKHFPFHIALFAIENYILLSNPRINYQLKLQ